MNYLNSLRLGRDRRSVEGNWTENIEDAMPFVTAEEATSWVKPAGGTAIIEKNGVWYVVRDVQ